MCGVPYHSCDAYIARLIAKGYKVAICEQMEDPATAKGLVERDIIRVVTPGTVIDSAMLEDGRSNYISGVFFSENGAGVCFADISTGKTLATAFAGPERVQHVINELGRFCPAEVILNTAAAEDADLNNFLRDRLNCHRERRRDADFELSAAETAIRQQYGEEGLQALPRSIAAVTMALGGLLRYLYETQKTDLSYINTLDYYEQGRFMELDPAAPRKSGAACCGCWTRPKPPWAPAACGAFWSAPCCPPPPFRSGRTPWPPWWATPWPGKSCCWPWPAWATWSG